MATLTIEIPDKVEKTLADLVEHLGGKVLASDAKLNSSEKKLSKKEKEFLKGFDEAVEYVNLHREGKAKSGTIDPLLTEV